MNKIIFEEGASVIPLDYESLKETQSLFEYNGRMPRNRPFEHHALILMIMDMAKEVGFTPEIGELYVAKQDAKRIMAIEGSSEGSAKSWLIQKMITKINIAEFKSSDYESSIGFSYTTNGITLAFGQNVRICNNMSIFGNNIMHTYGNSGKVVEPNFIIDLLKQWFLQIEEKTKNDRQVLESMKNHEFMGGAHWAAFLIGTLQMMAVRSSYIETSTPAPLNISQVSEFSKRLQSTVRNINDPMDVYSVYNIGTNILKPMNAGIDDLWQKVLLFGNLVESKMIKSDQHEAIVIGENIINQNVEEF